MKETKNLNSLSKDELINHIKVLEQRIKTKKYGLSWDTERERERE